MLEGNPYEITREIQRNIRETLEGNFVWISTRIFGGIPAGITKSNNATIPERIPARFPGWISGGIYAAISNGTNGNNPAEISGGDREEISEFLKKSLEDFLKELLDYFWGKFCAIFKRNAYTNFWSEGCQSLRIIPCKTSLSNSCKRISRDSSGDILLVRLRNFLEKHSKNFCWNGLEEFLSNFRRNILSTQWITSSNHHSPRFIKKFLTIWKWKRRSYIWSAWFFQTLLNNQLEIT